MNTKRANRKEGFCMPQTIHTLLTQYLLELKKIYGTYLKSVILYGSYARGDYTSDSDIDIMLLVDLSPEEMDAYSDELSELGYDQESHVLYSESECRPWLSLFCRIAINN